MREEIIKMAREADLWMTSDERIAAVERFFHMAQAAERKRQALANEALDKMAENARELGLDYEPADEPVAFASHGVVNWIADRQFQHEADLYTRPQPATWVDLTDEEFEQLLVDAKFTRSDLLMIGACVEDICNMVQARLKEKNT